MAGNGTEGATGDGGPARSVSLNYMNGLAVDPAGNLYIADSSNHRIRKVDTAGIITTARRQRHVRQLGGCGRRAAGHRCRHHAARPGRGPDRPPLLRRQVACSMVGPGDPGRRHAHQRGRGRRRGSPPSRGAAASSARLVPLDLALAPDGSLDVADVYFVGRVDLAAKR